ASGAPPVGASCWSPGRVTTRAADRSRSERTTLPPQLTTSTAVRPGPLHTSRTVTLEQGLAEFLTHLGLEKNASDKTVKSYREDLTQALAFTRERVRKNHVDPADWTTRLLRAFMAWLHDQGYAKSTVARRLAAVRSFGKFLC